MTISKETNADQARPSLGMEASAAHRAVIDLSVVQRGLTAIDTALDRLGKSPVISVPAAIAALKDKVSRIKAQLAAAAFEISGQAAPTNVNDAPAIIVRRTIGEAINRGDLHFGQKLPGQDIILVKVWEPENRTGDKLGRNIAHFAAPENLPGMPQYFNLNAEAVGRLKGWHGHDVWTFDRKQAGTANYEEALFRGYRDGTAINKWSIPELPVVNGQDRDRKPVGDPAQNMLALSRASNSPLYDTFVTIRGSIVADWSQSCTEDRRSPDRVPTVHFPDGYVAWYREDFVNHWSCVRPVVPLELNHLVI